MQGLGVGVAGIARHVRQHIGAILGHHALDVGQGDVFRPQPHGNQQIDAGQCRRPRAGGDQLDVGQFLALQQQPIANGRGHGDRGAVLIVMKHRDVHPGAEIGLDREAFRRLDVFQVDRAERRLQRRDNVTEAGRVGGVDLDVEHVDPGEFLEQDGLAFHYRLARQRAYIAQAQHRGAVGDHRHQVAAHRIIIGRVGIGLDRLARRRHPGRIGQRQIALRRHALGWLDRQLPGSGKPVVVERGLAKIVVHLCLGRSGSNRRTMVGWDRAGNMRVEFPRALPGRENRPPANGHQGKIF